MTEPRTPAEALAFFQGLGPSTIRLGLDRMHAALGRLGNPERRFVSVQVAGTNGKGSTSAMVAACLTAHGRKTGLYTSPHLVRVNERFQVDGADIEDAVLGTRLLEVLERLPELAGTPSPLTYFEVGTLVALWHFAREAVEFAVLEVGLGGRLDATTAVVPRVSAITPVSFDHMEFLGNTLDQIAREKAGICHPGVPLVVARQPPEAMAAIEDVATRVGAPLRREGCEFDFSATGDGDGGGQLSYRGRRSLAGLRLGLRGAHQRQNAAMALAILECAEGADLRLDESRLREGLASVRWPGRLETVREVPPLVLDAAHNPAGARALADALAFLHPGMPVHAVFGVLADKDYRSVLEALLPRFHSVHLTPLPSPRSRAPEAYAALAASLCPRTSVYAGIEEALAGADQAAQRWGGLVLGTGSLVLVGALKALLETRAGNPDSA